MPSMRRLLFSLLLASSTLWAVTPLPPITQPVMDSASLLSGQTAGFLNQELTRLLQEGGSQIAVLTVPRLEDETIEQFGIRVAESWKLGSSGKDNGVILLISAADRKVRIEVGQGLEGDLTDVYSSRIIREKMAPLFRDGDYDSGVIAGVAAIVGYTDPKFQLTGEAVAEPRSTNGRRGGVSIFGILFLIILVIIINAFGSGPRGPGPLWSGGRSYGGRSSWGSGGGFGGGGGGFGGGGGGFSGGGSSGSW